MSTPLPTSVFKYRRVATFPPSETVATFITSGTTEEETGRHEFRTLHLYELSCIESFRTLLPPLPKSVWLSLVPSRLEAPHSSLAYMVDTLARRFSNGDVIYAFSDGRVDVEVALECLRDIQRREVPVFLATTTVALSDFLQFLHHRNFRFALPVGSGLFETGGRKGRRSVPSSVELALLASELLGIPQSHFFGEYGMTEMSSPSWGTLQNGKMIFRSSPSGTVRIVTPSAFEEVAIGEEGMVRVFDSANVDSISDLLTGDWGRRTQDGFEILGRISDSEIRGCSLQVTTAPIFEMHKPVDLTKIKNSVRETKGPDARVRLAALSELTDRWSRPDHSTRKLFERECAEATFFSPGSVTAGLQRTFEALAPSALMKAAEQLHRSAPHKLAIQISAGNLPVTGVFNFYAFLLAGVGSFHRPSSERLSLLPHLHKDLMEICPELARTTAIVHTSSSDDSATRSLLQGANWIFAQGDDETLEHILSFSPSSAVFLPYGSGFSAAYVPNSTTTAWMRGVAEDLFIWEQQGCLSPQVIFGSSETLLIQEFLATTDEVAKRWNRTKKPKSSALVRWHRLESEARQLSTMFYEREHVTVAVVDRIEPKWFSTPGFVQWVPAQNENEVFDKLGPLEKKLSSIAAPEGSLRSLRDTVRRCGYGGLQRPDLFWRQNGIDRWALFDQVDHF
jgi:hypothetical protein